MIYIPVIPLGRKRIIDQCPACTRHLVLDLKKWESAKEVEITAALNKFKTNPTAEAAMATHQTLVNFHQMAEATEFRKMMRARFSQDATVLAYLGIVLEQLLQFEESAECFTNALALQPDLPDARVGVAESHIRAKRLDEARRLLDFLEKPGADQKHSLAPLEGLALACQQEGRHEEALQLFSKLIDALPVLAEHTAFRKNVEKSEKALKRATSLLPVRKFSWKRLFNSDPTAPKAAGIQMTWKTWATIGGVAAIVLIVAIAQNEYVRRHRTLHIVNTLPQSATVEVRGVGKLQVPRGTAELVLPEGRHRVNISGGVSEELDLDVSSDFFGRWFNDPVWVLNVGGAGVLMQTTATYSVHKPPPSYSFRFGQTLEYYPEITHPFTPLPDTIRMKSGESRTLTHLDLYEGTALELVQYFLEQKQGSEALRLAEWQLQLQPDDIGLLGLYTSTAIDQKQAARAEKFLQAGLTNQPVRIEWHRAYQNLDNTRVREARLATDYDTLLQAEPGNSALLYLRGRLAANRAESRRYFEQSVAADPKNPYPLYAQGHDRMNLGDWAAARKLFQQAATLQPDDAAFAHYLSVARFALGEYAALEQEYAEKLKTDALNVPVTLRLCDVLLAEGKNFEAAQLIASFELAASAKHGEDARNMINFLRRHLLYETGDFSGMEKHARPDNSPGGRVAIFHSLIEQGRVSDALKIELNELKDAEASGATLSLILALACTLEGNVTETALRHEAAIVSLEKGNADQVRAAKLLRDTSTPTQAELDEVLLPANIKAILLAYLAHRHPTRRAELALASRRLNVEHGFPYQLIQRATKPVR